MMWFPRQSLERKERFNGNGGVAVAIDKDKCSQGALKWAFDHLLHKGQTVILIHVKLRLPSLSPNMGFNDEFDANLKELFLTYRCFCTRKDIQCREVVLEDVDVANALIEYVTTAAIENIVIGASTRHGFLSRFKTSDIPGHVVKGAPDFCNVFVISKGKIQTMRSASRPAPATNSLRAQLLLHQSSTKKTDSSDLYTPQSARSRGSIEKPQVELPYKLHEELDFMRSPFTRSGYNYRPTELSPEDTDISFVSSARSSIDRTFPSFYDNQDVGRATPQISSVKEHDLAYSFESLQLGRMSIDVTSTSEFSSIISQESDRLSISSQNMEEVEAEMRRLKLELKQTMEMYSTACREAFKAKQKAVELQRWKLEEVRRLEEARLSGEAALALAQQEKAKSKAAIEAAEAARRIAELEAQKRMKAEMRALKEAEEKKKAFDALAYIDVRYRKYSIDAIEEATEFFTESRKIGEGGYGPVYKCYLDHTPVAIKVLRPDATQGRSQFQQEVEVLSCIRHPNMVLLLGACPEYGCLVYEFMENGSLEDRLLRRGNTAPLSWQRRFKIAAEIGTGLLFLHQARPEPLVHRDLKPGNILLDRNFVSKISDVGLARLVPPSVANSVTQYRMTSTAGTFCYIDPEYQQTGMLGVKSDIYSLGILFLQLITAKPPMGLTHHVGRAIEKGTFSKILDPAVADWPVEEALSFAKMALKCAELRRKDRPDLGKVIMPELERLRAIAEDPMHPSLMGAETSPTNSQVSLQLGGLSGVPSPGSCDGSRNPSFT